MNHVFVAQFCNFSCDMSTGLSTPRMVWKQKNAAKKRLNAEVLQANARFLKGDRRI